MAECPTEEIYNKKLRKEREAKVSKTKHVPSKRGKPLNPLRRITYLKTKFLKAPCQFRRNYKLI